MTVNEYIKKRELEKLSRSIAKIKPYYDKVILDINVNKTTEKRKQIGDFYYCPKCNEIIMFNLNNDIVSFVTNNIFMEGIIGQSNHLIVDCPHCEFNHEIIGVNIL